MPSKNTMMMGGAAAFCIALVCCSLCLYCVSRGGGAVGGGGGDAYRDLPTVPIQAPSVVFKGLKMPGTNRDATLQDVINQMFEVKSRCWQVNNFYRVTAPRILVKYSTVLNKFMDLVTRWVQTRAYPNAKTLKGYASIAERALRELQDALRDLLNCDEAATFEMPWVDGSRVVYNVRDFALKGDNSINDVLKRIKT